MRGRPVGRLGGCEVFLRLPDADVVDGEGLRQAGFIEGAAPVGAVAEGEVEFEVVRGAEGVGAIGTIGPGDGKGVEEAIVE